MRSFIGIKLGYALFYLKGVCPPEVQMSHIYRGVIPFVILQMLAVLMVFLWPSLVNWLPSVVYK